MSHHHKKDGSSLFKQRSLAAIHRKKLMERILKAFLIILSILMALAVLLAYTIG